MHGVISHQLAPAVSHMWRRGRQATTVASSHFVCGRWDCFPQRLEDPFKSSSRPGGVSRESCSCTVRGRAAVVLLISIGPRQTIRLRPAPYSSCSSPTSQYLSDQCHPASASFLGQISGNRKLDPGREACMIRVVYCHPGFSIVAQESTQHPSCHDEVPRLRRHLHRQYPGCSC